MERKHLHLKGPELSRIVAGAWRWNAEADVHRLVSVSLEAGITSFDHADIYGDYGNEKIFGEVLRKNPGLRKNMQLITKCGIKLLSGHHRKTWIKHYDTSKEHILASVDNSLKALGTDYIDLLLIHRPDPLLDPEEVSETFGLLKQNGKVLHFGVSNFSNTQFEMLQSYLPFPLVTNQVEVSLSKLDALYDGTLDTLLRFKACPMAWSPLGGGRLMSAASALWSKKESYKATETQLSLAWLLKHPSGMFPVIGTTQPERVIESAKAININLDRQDWFEMLKIASGRDVP
ncbi:aldo/keto reductase [Fulvivirgaceae bacterium PWU4]|uniref:Aldo/keto reductase n=1 Tax=Chryseosolibacter histidini TaxID=2782349 RepID=A0AAP2DPZ9_9BACT|nr:aldo/keto reductase [Chryseosolibacter histidini]MBT1700411.1 aldo/keto reductase [Chryseosolibacter histidini]